MNDKTFTALVILCITTHIIRTVYEILKHKKIVQASRLSFAIIFTNMALLWISWFTLCSLDVYKINLPAVVRYIGIVLDLLGLILFLTALLTIKTLETVMHQGKSYNC